MPSLMELNLARLVTRHASRVTDQTSPVTPNSIRNIIFDFGGVICNIDVKLTEKAFIDLGLNKFDTGHSISRSAGIFENIETGVFNSTQFRDELRKFFSNPVTDEQLDKAWNALLLDIPEARIRLIEQLRKNYRIFLLSNTTEIHYLKYLGNFRKQFGIFFIPDGDEKTITRNFQICASRQSPQSIRNPLHRRHPHACGRCTSCRDPWISPRH
ncbi:MAG: hypothetical protein NTW16_12635 [Bacteroidetes bacterium]|nr:hypothetical protein [Bacteroidota bacterium]